MMSEITSAEIFYEVSLREISNRLATLYGKWMRLLVAVMPFSECYAELRELEFSAYKQIHEDIVKRTSVLIKSLDTLFFVDTNQLNSAIETARQLKTTAEQRFAKENKIEEGIQLMKQAVDSLFKVYSDWKANRKNLERKALIKWCGVLGGGYLTVMAVYFLALSNMQINSNFTFGIVIPVSVGLFLLLLLVAIFSQE